MSSGCCEAGSAEALHLLQDTLQPLRSPEGLTDLLPTMTWQLTNCFPLDFLTCFSQPPCESGFDRDGHAPFTGDMTKVERGGWT